MPKEQEVEPCVSDKDGGWEFCLLLRMALSGTPASAKVGLEQCFMGPTPVAYRYKAEGRAKPAYQLAVVNSCPFCRVSYLP